MIDFVLDWQYIPDAKSVFEAVGNGVKDVMRNYNMSGLVPIAPSEIASNEENEKWLEIHQKYLNEKADIEWEWRDLVGQARSLNAETLIQSLQQLQEIQLNRQQQQHPEIVELQKAALSLKGSELFQQQFLLEQHLQVMFQIQEKQATQKLKDLEDIKDRGNSRSPQRSTAMQNLLLYGQDCLLLYGQTNYRVLVLVAPPAIVEDPDIPQNLRGNLPLDLQDRVKEFLAQHYSLELNAPVECHGDYFNEPISDWRVRNLFHLLQPIPAIVLYPKLKEETLTFQVGHWGISGAVKAVEFAPKLTLNWQELLTALLQKGRTEKEAMRLLRQTIVDLHRLVAAYLVDLHYLAIDAFGIYQPRLWELEAEFSLVAPQWAHCAEILRQVQAIRQQTSQRWHGQQEQIRKMEQQRRQEEERSQIDRWCCRETLWADDDADAGPVHAVAYSPDGRTLAAGYLDRTIKLWPLSRNRYRSLPRTFEGHTKNVNTIAYSPDGNTLASGSRDNTIKLWDVATRQCLRTFEGHTQQVQMVVYSPDGNTLASGSNDETIKLWNVLTGECLRTMKSDRGSILSLAYSPDGRILASGNNRATIELWDVEAGESFDELKSSGSLYSHSSSVWSLAYSPDGRTLASGSEDTTIKLWNARTGRFLATLQGHSQAVRSVTYSPDGQTLASASFDNTVKLWDVTTNRCRRDLKGHTHVVNTVAYRPDGNTLASGSYDGSIKIWGFPSL